MSNRDGSPHDKSKIAAEVHARINRTVGDPELQAALAELRALTPPGEPMFGFKVQAADARAEVPHAERVEAEDGHAIVADKEAASAYVEDAAPAAVPSPRMPTGRVRLNPAAAKPITAGDDTRRQVTQPSIRKGGVGPALPKLAEEPETPWATEGRTTEAPATVQPAQEPASGRSFVRRRGWIALAGGLVFAAIVVGLVLRGPTGPQPALPGMTASSFAPAPTSPSVTSSNTTTPTAMAAPSASEAPSSAPSSTPAATSPTAPSVAPKPSAAPAVTTAPPVPTSAAMTAPSAPAASNSEPLAPPAVTTAAASSIPMTPTAPSALPTSTPTATATPTASPPAGRRFEKD